MNMRHEASKPCLVLLQRYCCFFGKTIQLGRLYRVDFSRDKTRKVAMVYTYINTYEGMKYDAK